MGAGCGTQAAAEAGPAENNDSGGAGRLQARPSKPIPRDLPQYRSKKKMTHEQLLNERRVFWTSRVSGNSAIWNTLEQVAAMLLDSNDVDTANAILQASMISTPNGDLAAVYDETGVRYEIPRYCFQNPVNLVDGMEPAATGLSPESFPSEDIEIKFRIGNGSEQDDTKCVINTRDTIGDITEAFRKGCEAARNATRIRLFFYGREMAPRDICAACNLRKNGVVVLAYLYGAPNGGDDGSD